jgi:hypothetical protein
VTGGRATLGELRNGPAGRVIRERRYGTLAGFRLDGATVRAEHRGASAAEIQARLDRLEAQTRELDRTLGVAR